jgi:hypothetical protein
MLTHDHGAQGRDGADLLNRPVAYVTWFRIISTIIGHSEAVYPA